MSDVAFWILVVGAPALVGCAAGVAVTRRAGNFGTGAMVLVFPVAFGVLATLADDVVWDPNHGCTGDCWGGLVYLFGWLGASVGAELGLIGGTLRKAVRARRTRARDPRASSP